MWDILNINEKLLIYTTGYDEEENIYLNYSDN